MHHEHHNEYKTKETEAQAQDIDEGIALILDEVTVCCKQITKEHSGLVRCDLSLKTGARLNR
jgi:hypothetical protein